MAEGDAHDVILAAIGVLHAHLVVMSTHGRTALARLVMGSVADGVLRRTPVPLLLVRPPAYAFIAQEAAAAPPEAERVGPEPADEEIPVAVLMTPSEMSATVVALTHLIKRGTAEPSMTDAARVLLERLNGSAAVVIARGLAARARIDCSSRVVVRRKPEFGRVEQRLVRLIYEDDIQARVLQTTFARN